MTVGVGLCDFGGSYQLVVFFCGACAHAKRMAVGMLKVKLAYAPRFVRGWHDNGQALLQRQLVGCIHLRRRRDKPTHPNAARVVVRTQVPRRGTAARTLTILAKEDLKVAAGYGPEVWRIAPVPGLLPTKFLKPGETLRDVGNV